MAAPPPLSLTHFNLACYRLTLQALDPLQLPPVKSSALRGGFGHTFKRLVCFSPTACQAACHLANQCPYGYIFETAPPADSEVLRNLQEVPRPFIIVSPSDRNRVIQPGQRLSFGLTLVGQGMQYLAYFVLVFRELGRVGLGRDLGKFFLASMEAVSPYTAETVPVYQATDDLVRSAQLTVTGQAIHTRAASLPPNQLTLHFLTPTRLKHAGYWIEQGPPFQALVKALLGRISSLSYFHCGQQFQADFRGLIDRAARVRIVHSQTHWEDWSRFSGRQRQRIELGGLVGQITYAGDLQEYLPLLALGELVHTGKGTVFGNGQFQISP